MRTKYDCKCYDPDSGDCKIQGKNLNCKLCPYFEEMFVVVASVEFPEHKEV